MVNEFFNSSVLPIEDIFAGVIIGSLCSVVMALPAEFDVFSSPDQSMKFLSRQLEAIGYVEACRGENSVVYRPNLPRLLRWNEGNVIICKCEKNITVSAPRYIQLGGAEREP